MGRKLIILLLASVLMGCIAPAAPILPPPSAPPSPLPLPSPTAAPTSAVDPRQALAQLSPVGTLQEAARGCARALGGTPDAVRVKVDEPPKDGQCVPCSAPPLSYTDKGRPLAEAPLPLVKGSSVWLTIEDVICAYYFDGQEFKPSTILFW